MANSSSSSKRLVGLGLRGIRNSPPTQMTAQIKSVLSHHSPRTSPTLSSSPTSPKNLINANAVSPTLTVITTRVPSSSSITSTVTDLVSPNPRLRPCGRLRSFQGTLAVVGSNGAASASMGMAGTRSSPLSESFMPSGFGLSIPGVTTGGQKGITRLTGPVPSKVDGIGGTEGVVKKTDPSVAPCQVVDGRRGVARSKTDNGVIDTPPASSTNTCTGLGTGSGSGFGSGSGLKFSLADNRVSGDVADNSILTLGDDARDLEQTAQVPHKNRATPGDDKPERQTPQMSQAHSRSQSQKSPDARTPIQQSLQLYNPNSSELHVSGSPRIRMAPSPSVSRVPPHPFVDIPFPLHPEKTFRIHTSPLVGSPVNSTGAQLKTPGQHDVAPPPITPLTSSALPTSVSCPFPSGSSSGTRLSPKLSAAFKNLRKLSSALPRRFSSSFSGATARPATTSQSSNNDNPDSELILSPNTQRRMATPINEDMYKTPPSPCSGIYSPSPPSSERSPSSVTLLSSRVHWLRRNEKDEEEEGHREANYSTICSPSSTPFLHRRTSSMSPSPSFSPRRTRSGYSSPVAKIETILGPRERGIECIPESRDYQCSYSRLKMSPGSLTPLEEDKSLDLNAFMDEIGSRALGENEGSSPDLGLQGLGLGDSMGRVSEGSYASQQPVSGLPVTSPAISGTRPGGSVINSGSGAKAVATTRAGLRRKVTGMSSPLTQCIATSENVSNQSLSHENGVEFEGEEDYEAPMSPRLMHAKDSLLLRDVQRRKKRRTATTSDVEEAALLIGQTIQGIPVSTSAPTGMKCGISSDEANPSSLNPFRSPSQTTPLVAATSLIPLTPLAYIQLPETPTIRPSTRTVSGSRDLDDAISPLQLSSPTFPLTAIVKDSAWGQAPLAASASLNLGTLRVVPKPRQQRATCA